MSFLAKKELDDDSVVKYLSCGEIENCESFEFNDNVVYSDLNNLQLICSTYKGIGTGLDIDRTFYLLVTSCGGLAAILFILINKSNWSQHILELGMGLCLFIPWLVCYLKYRTQFLCDTILFKRSEGQIIFSDKNEIIQAKYTNILFTLETNIYNPFQYSIYGYILENGGKIKCSFMLGECSRKIEEVKAYWNAINRYMTQPDEVVTELLNGVEINYPIITDRETFRFSILYVLRDCFKMKRLKWILFLFYLFWGCSRKIAMSFRKQPIMLQEIEQYEDKQQLKYNTEKMSKITWKTFHNKEKA
ncbi:hypothetical protein VQ643_15635 [Pseudomonas sp. F1_0610]|uniref:hypothetical protein n=1 Tax=Pseudomonas sp. F1_0610 TaxID=3114284 RepID=UPI0039C16B4E